MDGAIAAGGVATALGATTGVLLTLLQTLQAGVGLSRKSQPNSVRDQYIFRKKKKPVSDLLSKAHNRRAGCRLARQTGGRKDAKDGRRLLQTSLPQAAEDPAETVAMR